MEPLDCDSTDSLMSTNPDFLPSTAPPFEYVKEHKQELITLTKQLLAIDSQNPPGSTSEMVTAIASFASDHDVSYERVADDPDKPNIILRLPGCSSHSLLFNGHLDTVPYDERSWSHDPLGEHTNDRIYGRGATDMKGAVAGMLQTIRGYTRTNTEPPMTLKFAFVSDEETAGTAGLPYLLSTNSVQADAAVIGEPTCVDGRHSVTVADKGSIWLTLEATGQAAHGSRPPLGENAIDRLTAAIDDIRTDLNQVTFELPAAVATIVERSIPFYAPQMGESTARELFRQPTINLGRISGGTAVNRVPETATAELDIRLTAGIDTQAIINRIQDVLEDYPQVQVDDMQWSIGSYQSTEDPIVQATTAAAEHVADRAVRHRSATGGGDAKKLRDYGIPTVEFAFGTGTMHATDEYITVEKLLNNALVYTQLPYMLLNALTEN